MPAIQCDAVYSRVLPGDLQPTHVRCTYIEGHPASCSYLALQSTDDAEREALRAQASNAVAAAPSDVQELVGQIEDGDLDRFLELILTAAHDRKRARRGVAGFPRVQREGFFRG